MGEPEKEVTDDYLHPIHLNTMGIPRDLLQTHAVYRPSLETRKLNSERGRSIYAEALIENPRLGPLSDLCMAALGKVFAPHELLPSVRNDKVKMRLYYDMLDIDLPLEECYFITDQKYWRRAVLENTTDKSLAFKENYDWRSIGLSMKFVELIETCPAEFWPENEMMPVALKIKDFVTEMHIRRLKSLTDEHFTKYFTFESDDSDYFESDSTSVESGLPTPRSTVASKVSSRTFEGSEEDGDASKAEQHTEADVVEEQESEEGGPLKTEEELQAEREYNEIRQARREHIEMLKREQQERRAARIMRRLEADARHKPPTPPPEPEFVPGTKKKKKKRKFRPKGVFDIPVEPDSSDEEKYIKDRRNKERCLRRYKKYNYPAKDCHHISLRFLRFFENLTVFTIEFLGPIMQRNYHERHLRFSYRDMKNLAFGISFLDKLQVFRLRNSLMDADKLDIIARALTKLPSLEVVDFGFDTLEDDCGIGLFELFRHSISIKSLELEYNKLRESAIHFLAIGLRAYGGKLEYLGLAGNPLGGESLHLLNEKILGTEHITHLCIRTAEITQSAIICCIANELLTHPPLQNLDLRAVSISEEAVLEILNTLKSNQTILKLDCRDCDLDEMYELDIEIILRRNCYFKENPYVGNNTMGPQEIDAFINRVKNPIYLRALEAVKRREECLKNRPDIISLESMTIAEVVEPASEQHTSIMSLDKLIPKQEEQVEEEEQTISMSSSIQLPNSPFVYNTENFTEEEFLTHIYLPGPGERYKYFHPTVDPMTISGETRNA